MNVSSSSNDMSTTNMFIKNNLVVGGTILGGDFAAKSIVSDTTITNGVSIRDGSEQGWVLTAINTDGDAVWAPTIETQGTVTDRSIAVYNGTDPNSLSASQASVTADGTIVAEKLFIVNNIRYEAGGVPIPGHVLQAGDKQGNLVFGPLAGGGNVTTSTGGTTLSIPQWTKANNIEDSPILINGSNLSGIETINCQNLVSTSGSTPNTVLASTDSSGKAIWQTVSNSMLKNSSLTITAGTGLTGGGSVSLGGSTTLGLQTDSLTITAGTGLSGGGSVSLGGSTTLSLSNSGVTQGTYGSSTSVSQITVDSIGRVTAASSVPITATVTSINTGTGLTGGPITSSGTISIDSTVVTSLSPSTPTENQIVTWTGNGKVTQNSSASSDSVGLITAPGGIRFSSVSPNATLSVYKTYSGTTSPITGNVTNSVSISYNAVVIGNLCYLSLAPFTCNTGGGPTSFLIFNLNQPELNPSPSNIHIIPFISFINLPTNGVARPSGLILKPDGDVNLYWMETNNLVPFPINDSVGSPFMQVITYSL
jgi:hypothetical protein